MFEPPKTAEGSGGFSVFEPPKTAEGSGGFSVFGVH